MDKVLTLDIPACIQALPVDADIKTILNRALEREPAARYPSAALFLTDLRRYQRKRGVRVSSSTFRSLMDHLFQEEQQEELRKNQFYFNILKDREMTDEDKTQVIAQDELAGQR